VIFVKGMMNGLIAVIALVLTAFSFWEYQHSPENTIWLIGVIVFLIATLVFGGLFLSGRVNKNDDVHITE
jgi:sugar phosphate permease